MLPVKQGPADQRENEVHRVRPSDQTALPADTPAISAGPPTILERLGLRARKQKETAAQTIARFARIEANGKTLSESDIEQLGAAIDLAEYTAEDFAADVEVIKADLVSGKDRDALTVAESQLSKLNREWESFFAKYQPMAVEHDRLTKNIQAIGQHTEHLRNIVKQSNDRRASRPDLFPGG